MMQKTLPTVKAEQNSRKRERGDLAVNKPETQNLHVVSKNIGENRIKLISVVHDEMKPQQGSPEWGKMVKLKPHDESSTENNNTNPSPALPDTRQEAIERLRNEGNTSSITLREHLAQVTQRYSLDLLSADVNGINITDKAVWKKIKRSERNLQFCHLIKNQVIPVLRKAIDQFLEAVKKKCLHPRGENDEILTPKNHKLIPRLREKIDILEETVEEFLSFTKTREELIKILYLLFITKDKTHKDYRDHLQWAEEELEPLRRTIQQELISIMISITNVEEDFTDYIPWNEGPEELMQTNDV